MKPVTMVGWSGSGSLPDLERSVLRKLGPGSRRASRVAGTLILAAADPVADARAIALLPGVAWVAAGYRFAGTHAYLRTLSLLGKRYLSTRKTFKLSAQSSRSEESAGDLVLSGNSELLATVTGSRVDEKRPHARFRVSLEGREGACGAEIVAGPGGTPTGRDWVACLVSGGERSSCMAWMAALSGYSIRLVHSKTDDTAMRQVARLYSELSFRLDPSQLELVLLDGDGAPAGRIGGWLRDHEETAFAGLRPRHPAVVARLARRYPNLAFPLLLLQEDSIESVYRSLGLGRSPVGEAPGLSLDGLEGAGSYSEARFGGVRADSNAVIDSLRRR